MQVTTFTFPDDPAATGYCVFPEALEDDALVFFHSTPANRLKLILDHGFKIPGPGSESGLQSVSFAKRSVSALDHAMRRRKSEPGVYYIIAARYDSIDRKSITVNLQDIHDYTLEPPPKIIAYCEVPESYTHT